MAQTFSFGFSNDDIEDENDIEELMELGNAATAPGAGEHAESKLVEPRRHTLQELLSTLPSKISYSTLRITTDNGRSIPIPRRELFDIRAQIMAEDSGDDATLTAGLSTDDITPCVYEGGFKTWECAVDLARHVLQEYEHEEGTRGQTKHVIELGAGTALPTLTLLHLALTHPHPTPHPLHFTLADYNLHVLRLASLPNLLLTWASATGLLASSPAGDLDLDPALLDSFAQDLQAKNISVDAISGAWGRELVRLVRGWDAGSESGGLVVLASETIYAPASIGAFTTTVLELLSRAGGSNLPPLARGLAANEAAGPAVDARALVAAKRVYFGVGGGVDEFLAVLRSRGGGAREVWGVGGEGAGVGRVVLEVRRDGG